MFVVEILTTTRGGSNTFYCFGDIHVPDTSQDLRLAADWDPASGFPLLLQYRLNLFLESAAPQGNWHTSAKPQVKPAPKVPRQPPDQTEDPRLNARAPRVCSVYGNSIRLHVGAMRQPLQLSLALVTGHAGCLWRNRRGSVYEGESYYGPRVA